MIDKRQRNQSSRELGVLDGGKAPAKTRVAHEAGSSKRRQFVPRDEFLAAFKGAPSLDYEELRADIDAYVDQDPTPRYLVE